MQLIFLGTPPSYTKVGPDAFLSSAFQKSIGLPTSMTSVGSSVAHTKLYLSFSNVCFTTVMWIYIKFFNVYWSVKHTHRSICWGNIFCGCRKTILPILWLIGAATVCGLVAFITSFCGGINLPADPSLWSPKARPLIHPGHNPGQRKH